MNPVSCEGFQELSSAFVDDQLEAAEILSLQEHLRGCPECRRFLADIYRLQDLCRAEAAHRALRSPYPGFAAVVSRKMGLEGLPVPARGEQAWFPWRRPLWTSLAGALAAALLVFAGWSWHRFSSREETRRAAVAPHLGQVGDLGSMDSYLRQHALLAIDATLLGPPGGMELIGFELDEEPGR